MSALLRLVPLPWLLGGAAALAAAFVAYGSYRDWKAVNRTVIDVMERVGLREKKVRDLNFQINRVTTERDAAHLQKLQENKRKWSVQSPSPASLPSPLDVPQTK